MSPSGYNRFGNAVLTTLVFGAPIVATLTIAHWLGSENENVPPTNISTATQLENLRLGQRASLPPPPKPVRDMDSTSQWVREMEARRVEADRIKEWEEVAIGDTTKLGSGTKRGRDFTDGFVIAEKSVDIEVLHKAFENENPVQAVGLDYMIVPYGTPVRLEDRSHRDFVKVTILAGANHGKTGFVKRIAAR